MAKRSDFTQKLLDDLRLRKERMGFVPSGQRSSSSTASVAGYKNSRWSFRGSGEAAASNFSNKNVSDMEATKMWLGNRNKAPLLEGGSQEVVPFGRNRSREHKIDMSMALALALSNSGKLQNIEILGNPTMGRKIVLHLDGNMTPRAYQFPSLSPSQIGEVAKGVQNLNMILRACSNGFNFNRDSIEIGRELLKGAMDLEESLKMLMTLQDASDYMVGSQGKQKLKLLKGKDDEDESQSHQEKQRKAGSRTKFSFSRERRDAEVVQQKQKAASNNEKSRYMAANYNSNSSTSSTQFTSNCRYISSGSGFKSEAPAVSHGSHKLVRFSSDEVSSISNHNQVGFKANPVSDKVRIPNVIAKLMGLEELPAPMEAKSTDMCKASKSPQLKELSNKVVEIEQDNKKEASMIGNSTKRMLKVDAQEKILKEKGMNNMAKNIFKSSGKPENRSPASKETLKTHVRNNGQIDVDNINHKSETRVRKEAVPQEEITITKQQTKARIEHTIPAVGNSLPKHTNDIRDRKKDVTVGKEENTRKQQSTDKIEQIDSSVKIIDSDHEQKSTLSNSDAKHNKVGKKELIQIKELVLKQQRDVQVTAIAFNQPHNERNSEPVQQLVHSSQSGEGIKETCAKKEPHTKVKLQSFVANKRFVKSKDIEKHLYEIRPRRTDPNKESANSNKKGLVNKNGSQSPKENLKISHNGKTNMRNKSNHNHHGERKLIEQSLEEGSPLKSDTRGEKMGRTLIQETVTRKSTHIQSVQKANVLNVREGDTSSRSSAEQRNSILEELGYRWKERNKKVEGTEKGSDATLELNLQQKVEIISSVNLSEDHGNMEITTLNPISGEETKTVTCSSPLIGEGNIQSSIDQQIQEVNVKSKKENSDSQLPERSCITMTECVDECSQEDSLEKYQEIQSRFTKNNGKVTDPRRILQFNGCKSILCQDRTIMEVDQQVLLTKDEDTLKQILVTSQKFLNVAQALFQIKIPVDMLQATENASPDKDARLVIDCGFELLSRKGKREELSFSTKETLAPLKRSLDELIKEVNADIESLKYQKYTEGCGYDLADCLNKMIEKDIQHRHPDINCLWDFGWDRDTFVCMEKYEIAIDVEKHVLNGLLNELARDLLNISISIH